MAQLFDSLKAYINPAMISKASEVLNEKESNVSTAVSSILASFMGVMLKKGNTPQIRNIFEEAGNLNILADIDRVCEEKPSQDQQKLGDDFLLQLLGDKAEDFTTPIAKSSGISKVATNRLVSMLAPVAAGFFGNKLVKDEWSLHKILAEINNDKDRFAGLIPAGLIGSFGLHSALSSAAPGIKTNTEPVEEKKKNGWLKWLILLLVLLAIFLLWRSCRETTPTEVFYEEAIVTDTVAAPAADVPAASAKETLNAVTLPDGTIIQVYAGGVEEQMLNYLKSGDYKNATDDDLKNKWFEFDNIDFEFGSSTDLKDNSKVQLNNIIAILKNYKDAKVKVGGFADKVGSEKANIDLSKKRAKTIESLLEKGGVGAQVAKVEGYGEQYAKQNVNAPDSLRAKDRDIALRFVK